MKKSADNPKGWTSKIKTAVHAIQMDAQHRVFLLLLLFCAGFLAVYLADNVITHIDTKTWSYEDKEIFPHYPPIGNDFRVGNYEPAYNLWNSHFTSISSTGSYDSIYPPLVALLNLPYILFDVYTAYLIHVAILILANLACLWMSIWLCKLYLLDKLGLSSFTVNVISLLLFTLSAFYVFSSYFFAYSMERGNTDILALFYSMLALVVLVKQPKNIWLQIILLSVAVHIKIYPVILFFLLLFKHGKKLILPALLVNLAFLFILGPKVTVAFIQSLTAGGGGAGIGNGWSNVGNHASYSFTMGVDPTSGPYLSVTFFEIWATTFLVPLVIWGITAIAIALKKFSNANALQFFMITVPLFGLLPTMSMDYRLVIFGSVICFTLALILKQFVQKFTWFDLIQLALFFAVLLMLGRSYRFVDKSLFFIRDKYLWVLMLEVWMSVNILRNQKACYQASGELNPPSTNG